ncbi:hypothetical protein [Sulfurospirillum diekertiae]|uniref:Uncharacterized protein n=1 Tax=Sulfurospirillum diekertiae TaxID=1854492 RepID=A0A1Y0HJ05_9BACT|nr:hypothetical protein [Sulfurospirillum diekertiae]ARU48032.1 hypothetical protein Sdiek1_0865 [Sulfurospirillum diekertiae]ASC92878.1 hypothetical protein Sdiek2_0856 [Sulfurospirillum diekertiae]
MVLEDEDSILFRQLRYFKQTGIFCRINHTERTWGIDIESLLTGHVKSLTKMPSKLEQFLYKNSSFIGFLSGLLFFASMLFGAWNTYSIYRNMYLENINVKAKEIIEPIEFLTYKINNLLDFVIGGTETQLSYIFSAVLFASFIISIILGGFIGSNANNRPKSFVLLSSLAISRKTKTKN